MKNAAAVVSKGGFFGFWRDVDGNVKMHAARGPIFGMKFICTLHTQSSLNLTKRNCRTKKRSGAAESLQLWFAIKQVASRKKPSDILVPAHLHLPPHIQF